MKLYKYVNEFFIPLKNPKLAAKIILFDLLFYVIIIPGLIFAGNLENLGNDIDINSLSQTSGGIETLTAQAESYLAIILSTWLLLLIIGLAAWALSGSLIYSTLLDKKFTKSYYLKFAGLSAVYGTIAFMILIFFGIIIGGTGEAALIYPSYVLLGILGYFAVISYVLLTKTHKAVHSFGNSLILGIESFKKIFPEMVGVIIIILIASFLNYIMISFWVNIYATIALFIIFGAWARIYFVNKIAKIS